MASSSLVPPTPNIFDPSAPPQQGARATESAHRKVELQHPADWTYLLANATNTAKAKIDHHLASTPLPANEEGKEWGEEDEQRVRERVVEMVDEYIRATYDAAKDSVSINGLDAREMEAELEKYEEGQEIEPFDAKLAQRIQDLSAQVEAQTLLLADLRRTAPKETARKFRMGFENKNEVYGARIKAGEDSLMEAARATNVELDPVPRAEEMQRLYSRGAEGLEGLKSGIGGTIAKMERAQKAVEVLET